MKMRIKTASVALVFVFLFSTIVGTKHGSMVRAETTEGGTSTGSEYLVEEDRIEGVGTYFEVINSPYLNITLTSTETVLVILESVPGIVSFIIEKNSSATSTVLTLTGFEPDTTYYRYQDGYLVESFVTDTSGEYIYTQDVSQYHHVFFQEHVSTIYLDRDYTFSADIHETIFAVADNITIDGNGYTSQGPGDGFGIYLLFRKGITLKNFVITGWTHGIFMYRSKFNTFINNTVVNNPGWVAIRLESSPNNTFETNTIANNPDRGLVMWYSGGTTLRNNNFTGNFYNFGLRASGLEDYMNDIDTSNTVDGKILYYFINQSNLLIDPLTFPNAGYLGVINSINITVRGLDLTKNRDGLHFAHTMNSTIENVHVLNNKYNMILFDSHYNTIRGNTISNGWVGITLWYPNPWYPAPTSIHNKIYHNNFLNNTVLMQVMSYSWKNSWDDGYPSGGNYWSDYAGVDEYSGPGQDQPGSDGIGDTPYRKSTIPRLVYDRYPLMQSWVPVPEGLELYIRRRGAHGTSGVWPEWHVGLPDWTQTLYCEVFNYGEAGTWVEVEFVACGLDGIESHRSNQAWVDAATWVDDDIVPGQVTVSTSFTPGIFGQYYVSAILYFKRSDIAWKAPYYRVQDIIGGEGISRDINAAFKVQEHL